MGSTAQASAPFCTQASSASLILRASPNSMWVPGLQTRIIGVEGVNILGVEDWKV